MLDSFRGEPSDSLPLLVGFDLAEVDHDGRLSAMGGMGLLVVVEGDPSANAGIGLRAGLPSVQIDALWGSRAAAMMILANGGCGPVTTFVSERGEPPFAALDTKGRKALKVE